MGFFSSILTGIGTVLKESAGALAIKAIEYVSDLIGSSSRDVGSSSSYNTDSSTLSETVNINEILTKFSLQTRDKTDHIEETILDDIDDYFSDLENDISGKIDPNILRHSLKDTKREIRGLMKNHISSNISIDNSECREILSMEKGDAKTQCMAEFQTRIINDAVDELEAKLTKAIKRNETILFNSVKSYLKAEEEKILQAIKGAKIALKEKTEGVVDDPATKIEPIILLAQSEAIKLALADEA